EAAAQVGPALFVSLLIITFSFVPVFTLEAQEGRLFSPLAFTKTYAMAAAAGLAVTLIPWLMGYLIRGRIPAEEKNPLNRFLIALYRPLLEGALRRPKTVLVAAVVILVATYWPASRLGGEFMPPLDDGDLLYMPSALPGLSAGTASEWVPPIRNRIDMLATGIKSPVGVKVAGTNLKEIDRISAEVERTVKEVPGVSSALAERLTGGRYIDVNIDRDAAARYGLNVADVHSVVTAAIGGDNIGETIEGLQRFPINVRYPREMRDSVEKIRTLPLPRDREAQDRGAGDARNHFRAAVFCLPARRRGTPHHGHAAVRARRRVLAHVRARLQHVDRVGRRLHRARGRGGRDRRGDARLRQPGGHRTRGGRRTSRRRRSCASDRGRCGAPRAAGCDDGRRHHRVPLAHPFRLC